MMTVDRSDSTRNHFVYRYFDSQGRLLYVGCAVNLDRRWQEHRLTRPGMASQVSAARIAGPFCFQVARSVERKAPSNPKALCMGGRHSSSRSSSVGMPEVAINPSIRTGTPLIRRAASDSLGVSAPTSEQWVSGSRRSWRLSRTPTAYRR